MRRHVGRPAAIMPAWFFITAGGAQAADPAIVVENGRTQPALGYADAIRERVFIPLPGIDQTATAYRTGPRSTSSARARPPRA